MPAVAPPQVRNPVPDASMAAYARAIEEEIRRVRASAARMAAAGPAPAGDIRVDRDASPPSPGS